MLQTKIVPTFLFLSLLLLAVSFCSKVKEPTKVQEPALPLVQPVILDPNPVRTEAIPTVKSVPPSSKAVPKAASIESPNPSKSQQPFIVSTPHPAPPEPVTEPETTARAEPESVFSSQRQPTEVGGVASPPSPPRRLTALLPQGTVIEIRLTQALSSQTNQSGDKFSATLDRDLTSGDKILIPHKSRVLGQLLDVVQSGKVEGRARMSLVLTTIELEEESYPIETNTITIETESTKGKDAKVVGGGAGLGALIGGIFAGKKGAAIGAAIGGGAATARVLTTKGRKVELQPEQKFSFRLETDISVPLR